MRALITNVAEKCVGCNRCTRVCPIYDANITTLENGRVVVVADEKKCIVCGACLVACHHGARLFEDDTESFFEDLQQGVEISLFVAPAMRTNFPEWERMLTWFRKLGVKLIYDVSLGADICTWAHVRYLQKNSPGPIISQPCPAIVNYIQMHNPQLIPSLSPVHSPMLCTAIYMKKHKGIHTKIAALSPCVAKANEFEETGYVHYNVTFKNIQRYMANNNITLPSEKGVFDHLDAGLGALYPMPGGLKECVEHYLGKKLRIDKSEGIHKVFKDLAQYAKISNYVKPDIFDVLNCEDGCNIGTACAEEHWMDLFDISYKMDQTRKEATEGDKWAHLDNLFAIFDEELQLNDFIRRYTSKAVEKHEITHQEIDKTFALLNKHCEQTQKFDCGACGSDTCLEMVERIAAGVDIPQNCLKKTFDDIKLTKQDNVEYFATLADDSAEIKQITKDISKNVDEIKDTFEIYESLISEVEDIALSIRLISINASIEATRAGGAGRTFSVVAEEIRKLAASSTESARRTRATSGNSVDIVKRVVACIRAIDVNMGYIHSGILTISESTIAALEKLEEDFDNNDEFLYVEEIAKNVAPDEESLEEQPVEIVESENQDDDNDAEAEIETEADVEGVEDNG